MNDPKDKKKISPDSTDDENSKKYHNEEIMEAVFGDDDDDNEVVLGDGEVAGDGLEDINKDKKKDKKTQEVVSEEDDSEEQELSDADDVDEEDEEEEEQEVEVKSKKKKEEKEEVVQLKITDEIVDALKPYKGNINERVNELIKAYKAAMSKVSSFGYTQKVIDELGLANESQDKVIGVFKDLKSAYYDFLVYPEVLDVLDSFANGKIPDGFKDEVKTVQNFMPEGEMYSHEEAMSDPTSHSYKAYEQWENNREETKARRRKLIENIQKHKGNLDKQQPQSSVLETLNNKFSQVKQFAKEEFDMDDQTYSEFVQEFKELPVEAIKIALAMHARKKGIESVKARKLSKNKNKMFVESITEDQPHSNKRDRFEQEKDKEKYYSSAFKDWDDDDKIY